MPDLSGVPNWVIGVAQILVILVVALLSFRFAKRFVHKISGTILDRDIQESPERDQSLVELKRRVATLESLVVSVIQFLVIIVAGLMILDRLGIDIGPVLAGLGVAGVAVGFGAQSLVKDYFNGILILIEDQYGVGDVVRIAGVEGTVEGLTLRITILRDFEGNIHTVPNSSVVVASNLTRGWARITQDLHLPSADLADKATDVINEVGRVMGEDPLWRPRFLAPPHLARIDTLGPSGLTLRVRARVAAPYRFATDTELKRRLQEAFRANGLPYTPMGSGAESADVTRIGEAIAAASAASSSVDLDRTPSRAGPAGCTADGSGIRRQRSGPGITGARSDNAGAAAGPGGRGNR